MPDPILAPGDPRIEFPLLPEQDDIVHYQMQANWRGGHAYGLLRPDDELELSHRGCSLDPKYIGVEGSVVGMHCGPWSDPLVVRLVPEPGMLALPILLIALAGLHRLRR